MLNWHKVDDNGNCIPERKEHLLWGLELRQEQYLDGHTSMIEMINISSGVLRRAKINLRHFFLLWV